MTKAAYTQPQLVCAVAVNARSTRSGRVSAAAPGTVVRGPVPRLIPRSPAARISRATVKRATGCPCRHSSAWTARTP
jgi:hypothetical protein